MVSACGVMGKFVISNVRFIILTHNSDNECGVLSICMITILGDVSGRVPVTLFLHFQVTRRTRPFECGTCQRGTCVCVEYTFVCAAL